MAKLCPFKKTIITRIVSDVETAKDEEFCLCDEERCIAYFHFDIIKCALMRKDRKY